MVKGVRQRHNLLGVGQLQLPDDAHLPCLRFPLWNAGTSAGGAAEVESRDHRLAGPAGPERSGSRHQQWDRNSDGPTASYNVARRPYYIEIFITPPARSGGCGSGMVCHRIGPDHPEAATPCRTLQPTSPSTAPRTLRQITVATRTYGPFSSSDRLLDVRPGRTKVRGKVCYTGVAK